MIHRTHHVLRLALVALFASTGAFVKLNAPSGARLVAYRRRPQALPRCTR